LQVRARILSISISTRSVDDLTKDKDIG